MNTFFGLSYNSASDHAHSEYISSTQIMTGIVPDTDWVAHVRMLWFQISVLQGCTLRTMKTYIPGCKLVNLNDQYTNTQNELLMMCHFRGDKKSGLLIKPTQI